MFSQCIKANERLFLTQLTLERETYFCHYKVLFYFFFSFVGLPLFGQYIPMNYWMDVMLCTSGAAMECFRNRALNIKIHFFFFLAFPPFFIDYCQIKIDSGDREKLIIVQQPLFFLFFSLIWFISAKIEILTEEKKKKRYHIAESSACSWKCVNVYSQSLSLIWFNKNHSNLTLKLLWAAEER